MDATPHIIESALLLLVAFLLGCVVGYFARRISGSRGSSAAKPAVPLTVDAPAPASEAAISAQSVSKTPVGKAPRAGRAASVKGSSQPVRKKVAATTPVADDLKNIRGIGPRLEAALNSHGINRYAQIAKWSKKTIAELDAELQLRGRVEREQWVEQAKALNKPEKKG
jgi:predicted flap endonuclease-1-like 5' DNA nuclease